MTARDSRYNTHRQASKPDVRVVATNPMVTQCSQQCVIIPALQRHGPAQYTTLRARTNLRIMYIFTARRYDSAVCTVALCPSVLSVTSREFYQNG